LNPPEKKDHKTYLSVEPGIFFEEEMFKLHLKLERNTEIFEEQELTIKLSLQTLYNLTPPQKHFQMGKHP
jgi:hypothetical protein